MDDFVCITVENGQRLQIDVPGEIYQRMLADTKGEILLVLYSGCDAIIHPDSEGNRVDFFWGHNDYADWHLFGLSEKELSEWFHSLPHP